MLCPECEPVARAWLREGARVANEAGTRSSEGDAGTVRSNSRTRRFNSASAIRCAVCSPRKDPPRTRDRLNTALEPQAKQYGVLFLLINSHSTQNTAVCKLRKLMSCPVSFSAIFRFPSASFSWRVNAEKYMARPEFRSDRAGSALWITANPQLACAATNPERWSAVGIISNAGVTVRSKASANATGNTAVSRLMSNCNSRSV